jgi:hypothetical protein
LGRQLQLGPDVATTGDVRRGTLSSTLGAKSRADRRRSALAFFLGSTTTLQSAQSRYPPHCGRYPGPTREDVVYAERGQAEYKGLAENSQDLCSTKPSTTLFYNVQSIIFNETECTAQPATKSPEVASHRPGGFRYLSRAQTQNTGKSHEKL